MASKPVETTPRWLADLRTVPATKTKPGAIADPPGYTSSTAVQQSSKFASKQSKSKDTNAAAVAPRKPPTPEQMDTLKLKKAWELALAPAKQLPMNAIGMYMSGNSLQIFSIMMVFMLFKGPITALFNIQGTFQRLETDGNKQQMILVKLAFIGCNLLALALGMWKINGMGLLPTTRSDWLAWESAREPLERAYYIP